MTAEFEVIDPNGVPELEGHGGPFTRASGDARTRYYAPPGFDQFIAHGTLGRGATLAWDGHHGDEALYVLSGEMVVDGQRVGPKGAIVIESDVATAVEATTDSQFVHVGSTVPGPRTNSLLGPPDTETRGVHVHHDGAAHVDTYDLGTIECDGMASEDVVNVAYFTDGRCPSCRIALFRVWGDGPHRGKSHSHATHELITVTAGELQVGRDRIKTGMTAAIPADRRYRFNASGPWEFLNFRSDAEGT